MNNQPILKSTLFIVVCYAAAFGQDLKPVIDNERVTVWDVTWTKGQTNPARGHDHDVVTMWIAGGKAGTASYSSKSEGPAAKGRSDAGARSLVIELKDHPVPPLENKTGYPLAFPRPHVKKVLENDRVIVWSYRWNPGEPTPMHFHDKDVVVVYLEPTALTSTTLDSAATPAAGTTHTELLERGTGSAMMMELK
jgi:hypothetical protein